ncbi:hypothetical protein T01_10380 [Trichinella spiralis]|uniref:Uncharacterized protein n=1 Tax=Trichinella spiralis TaxID=6334 RepID=A0A0V1B387_TRISP|nr:hypothetical protein T01_10380 [Trichinella spiralis]
MKATLKFTVNPLVDCWGVAHSREILVRSTEHHEVERYVVGLLKCGTPLIRKTRPFIDYVLQNS